MLILSCINFYCGLFKRYSFSSVVRLYFADMDSEEPPEPAPPEVPPHRDNQVSNAITLKQPSNFILKIDKNGDQIHEEYIPQNQHGWYFVFNFSGIRIVFTDDT